MQCLKCKSHESYVIDSRPREATVYRRRRCEECGYRWSTTEVPQDQYEKFGQVAKALRSLDRIRDHIDKIIEPRKS
jgi:transcriptional repressor NrdR